MASSSVTVERPTVRKALPESVSGLLEVAIYSFGCQAGLRSYHKLRGDPILEGVCSFFGRLLLCSSPKTLAEFESIAEARLGGWKPGQEPSKQLMMLVSSRLKSLKEHGAISEDQRPVAPPQLLHKEQRLTEDDLLQTKFYPKCWRCGTQCAFCEDKKELFPNFVDFRYDTTSPFLEVLEDMLEDKPHENVSEDDGDDSDIEETEQCHMHYQEFLEKSFEDTDDSEFQNKD